MQVLSILIEDDFYTLQREMSLDARNLVYDKLYGAINTDRVIQEVRFKLRTDYESY